MIDDIEITNLIQMSNIVSVISEYLPLIKSGANYKTRCPFHQEKTPSFVVNEQKQIFHCFGCGIGGNVVTFIMKYENLNFIESIKLLAKKNGVTLNLKSESAEDYTIYFKIMEMINVFNKNNLKNSREAKQYLLNRKFTEEIIKEFNIGYAGNNNNEFLNFIKKNNLNIKLLEKLGLVSITKDNNIFYRFNNRIIFPIYDLTERLIAFGGRVWQDDNKQAKYINSPDSPIYKKGNNLYNLNSAKKYITKEDYVILSEGYVDVIMLHKYGFKNSVASLGTALTEQQAKLLMRYTKNIFVIYDADSAGQTAAERSIEILLKEGIVSKIVTLDEDLDPADFLLKYGAEEFRKKIDSSEFSLDYKLRKILLKYNAKDLNHKKIILNQIFPLLSLTDLIIKNVYFKKLSELLQIDEKIILYEYNKFSKSTKEPMTKSAAINEMLETKVEYILPDTNEIELLACMMMEPKSIKYINFEAKELNFDKELVPIFNIAFEKNSLNISNITVANEQLINKLTERMLELEKRLKTENDVAQYIEDLIKRLKNKKIKKEIEELNIELQKYENDKEKRNKIIFRKNELQKTMKNNLIKS